MLMHWAVKDMDNAIYEVDIYDPEFFMRILWGIGELI